MGTVSDPAIHPEARDPAADFGGWIDRLIREAREAGAGDDALLAELDERADRLQGNY